MCRPVSCKNCNKTTWAGCGQHVAAVKASVPAGQWCACTDAQKAAAKSAPKSADGQKSGGFLGRLFGR